jgi:hypothetical protein
VFGMGIIHTFYQIKLSEALAGKRRRMIHKEPSLSFKTTVSLDIDGNIRIAGDEKSVVFNRAGAGEEKDNCVELTWQELAEFVLEKNQC